MICNASYLLFAIVHFQIILFCSAQQHVGDVCQDSSGMGVCQLASNCRGISEDISQGNKPTVCGNQGSDPIVCCPSARPQPVESSRIPGETAKKWCQTYQKSCPKWVDVPGSDQALPGEFPHMAAIGFGDEKDISWYCGGTLISEKFVLTAAHCNNSHDKGRPRWVLLGAVELINTTASDGKKGQIHPIIRMIPHPLYKPPAKYSDIALFEIGPAVTPNPRPLNIKELHPACLSENRTFSGEKAIAAGWGRTGYAEDSSPVLLKKRLEITELSVCQKVYDTQSNPRTLGRGIVPSMLCAAVREGERDTCQGDGGVGIGSFVRNGCTFEVWGLSSFGKLCGDPKYPGVYTKVYEYIQWIEDIVWPA